MEEDLRSNKLGKRLSYVLRYGAVIEGLEVSGDGFVNLDDLLHIGLIKRHSREEVIAEVNKKAVSGKSRFELVCRDGRDMIRASYGRNFRPAQKHHGGNVFRLLEICMSYVCSHIKNFDLEDFPDSYILNQIFYRLKFEKKLTNSAMPSVIGRVMDAVDFTGIYITQKTLNLIYERLPNLQALSLKECSYLITDNVLCKLVKSLPLLKRLNICACESVTDQGIQHISKYLKNLVALNISYLPLVTEKGLKELVSNCLNLGELYVCGNSNVDQALIGELQVIQQSQHHSKSSLVIFASCNTLE